MSETRSEGIVCAELARAGRETRKAIEAEDFSLAAHHRGRELELQREWQTFGGPRPGCYRIRIDRPDGTHTVSEAPTLREAVVFHDVRDVSEQLDMLREGVLLLNRVFATLDHPFPPQSAVAP